MLRNPPFNVQAVRADESAGDTFLVLLPAGSAPPRAALFPSRVGPSLRRVSLFYSMLLAYLVGGAPQAASPPSRSGLTQ